MQTGKKPYLYVSLFGRIGNNMFQLATAASLAHRYDCAWVAVPDPDYRFPDGGVFLDYLQMFRTNILRNVDLREGYPICSEVYHEPDHGYQPIPWSEDLMLYGYFQSEKYFVPECVRRLFAVDDTTRKQLDTQYGDILALQPVSINVRRGDYLQKQHYHPVCSMDYYEEAISRMGRNRHYLITSDDLDWCRSHFTGDNFHFARQTNAATDLYLPTLCTDNILSNSSFSWWGAWLNLNPEKRVIAPKKWYGARFTYIDTADLLPPRWEPI